MIIRHRNRERMIVQFAWHKGTHYKVWPLECLMHWWWLMHTTRDWLEIGNIENPGILVAIPPHSIARVKIVPIAGNVIANFQAHLVVSALSVRYQFFGNTNITLTIG